MKTLHSEYATGNVNLLHSAFLCPYAVRLSSNYYNLQSERGAAPHRCLFLQTLRVRNSMAAQHLRLELDRYADGGLQVEHRVTPIPGDKNNISWALHDNNRASGWGGSSIRSPASIL